MTQSAHRFIFPFLRGLFISLFFGTVIFGFVAFWFAGALFARGAELNALFFETAGRSTVSIAAEALGGVWVAQQEAVHEPYRVLVLGTDEVAGSGRSAVLTDTLMIASYNPETNAVSLVSLPRDLYHPEYATKINALYFYGQERYPTRPETFPAEVLTDMTGLDFESVLVISLADVQNLIDLVGGVEIDVPKTFTDDQFPRDGVDVSVETDPVILYETITFEEGVQRMDGKKALQYIRTRKSSDPNEGTDESRTRRQRQVLTALANQLTDPNFVANPVNMGRLYRFYAERYQQEASLYELGVVAGEVIQNRQLPEFISVEMPVTAAGTATDSATLFVHPPVEKYGQWVYEPVDPTWQQLREFMQQRNF